MRLHASDSCIKTSRGINILGKAPHVDTNTHYITNFLGFKLHIKKLFCELFILFFFFSQLIWSKVNEGLISCNTAGLQTKSIVSEKVAEKHRKKRFSVSTLAHTRKYYFVSV